MISVVLVDDQNLVRQGIRSLLELSDKVRIVGEASDGAQGLEEIALREPDVVLLDVQMPVMNGIDCLRQLRADGSPTPVIVLTTFDDPDSMIECTRLGARGYLLKDVSLEQLVSAIEIVYAGGTMIQPTVTATILERLSREATSVPPVRQDSSLTPRETEILRCLAGGLSNREVARAISLSEGTVKNYVSSILAKLEVRDRTRAVLKAIDLGLI